MEKRYIFWSSFLTLTLIIRASCECFIHSYTGTLRTTISGITCQRWDNWFPHVIDISHRIGYEHADYCRNPNGSDYVWCYTLDPNVITERCAISKCVTTTAGNALSYVSTNAIHVSTDSVPVTTNAVHVSTENVQPSTDNNQITTDNVQPSTDYNQITTDNVQSSPDNNHITTDNVQSSTDNNQITTDNVESSTDNNQITTDNVQPSTDNNQITTDNSQTGITSISSTQNDATCYCPCDSVSTYWYSFFHGNLTDEEKVEIITKEKDKIRAELLIDIKGLSSYKRKKTCAEDNRLVAVSIGRSLGIGIIITVICLIVLADFHTFRMVLRKPPRN